MKTLKDLNYATDIKVKIQREGYHRWYKGDVAFLRNYHRHMFIITAIIGVGESRELEFFKVQKELESLLDHHVSLQEGSELVPNFSWVEFYEETGVYDEETEGMELVIDSCEVLAKWLVYFLEKKYGIDRVITVEVSEDGENSAIVTNA